ncbi:MAG TPA: IS1182 family transposase [Streptosporangiaceae bacterium]|nr:IS1182 family transposase [Streptosporangiaceae bacterium]
MTLGLAPRQADLFGSTAAYCEGRVAPDSIYGILHRECFRLFPDEMFADLFDGAGRRSVPPVIVAVVMVLQRIEGCSDREAADRFAFDARWKYAAGGLDFDYPGFVHTVLVDMRARLAGSARPDRIFEVTLEAARAAGLAGRRRVLDSTPLYDAVATMDTVTLVRSAIRGLLKACDGGLAGELRGLLRRDDDYAAAGKPACDYDDAAAREDLVDALAKDARVLLAALDGRELDPVLGQAATLLATVTGQDLEESAGGVFRIARKVAADRVISTVDPQARHGHKTSARGFDGYKGHIASDPDSEIITATQATAGNSGDAEVAESLLGEMLPGDQDSAAARHGGQAAAPAAGDGQPAVYGDAAYGSGELIARLDDAGIYNGIKCQPPAAVKGCFPKDRFAIDLDGKTVTCPAGVTVPIRPATGRHAGTARFAAACRTCPLAARCTGAKEGRTITIGPHEARLAAARIRQADPAWKADYRATRPKVERKIGHLMRRRHGGRRARVRGLVKVAADFALLAAAVNLARLGVLGVAYRNGAWAASSS